MATLFQLNSGINELPANLEKLSLMGQENDCVLLLDKTAIFISWFLQETRISNHLSGTANLLNQSSTKASTKLTHSKLPPFKLHWYALSDDFHSMQKSTDSNLQFIDEAIEWLSDEQWVDLVNKATKIVSLY